MGCDDYIAKPFLPMELVIRTRNLLNRLYKNTKKTDDLIINDIYKINKEKRIITDSNNIINLTSKEFDFILMLIENKNSALSREQIISYLYGQDYFGSDRTIDDLARRVRKKLPKINIETIYGYGYRWCGFEDIFKTLEQSSSLYNQDISTFIKNKTDSRRIEDLTWLKEDIKRYNIYIKDTELLYIIKSYTQAIKDGMYKDLDNYDFDIICDLDDVEIRANYNQFKIIIENLLENQIRYANKKILINLKNEDENILIQFFNDGKKSDENIKIFELFKKGEDGQTGIGLYIVKKLLVLNNATIKASNYNDLVLFEIKINS